MIEKIFGDRIVEILKSLRTTVLNSETGIYRDNLSPIVHRRRFFLEKGK